MTAPSEQRRSIPTWLFTALPAALTAVVVWSWFAPGTFIARGDVPPFVRTPVLREALSMWGHQFTSGGSPSYQVVRAPELAIVAAADLAGLSPATAQRIFFALVAAGVVLAATYFARAFTTTTTAAATTEGDPRVAGVAGLLAFFNPFVLQRLPNVLTCWALIVLGTTGGLTMRVALGHRRRPVALAVASMSACYLAINPPLLVMSMAWIVLLLIGCAVGAGRDAFVRAARFVAGAVPWAVGLNLWWVVPFGLALGQAGSGQQFAAETAISSWSWSHARNSVANVVSLSGHWGWSSAEYFPYAAAVDRFPLRFFKFGAPALALLAPLLSRSRRRLSLAMLALVGPLVFLGKGLHPPGSGLNRFLYERIPLMALIREPLGKVGPLLLLLFVALAVISMQSAVAIRVRWPLVTFVAGTLVVAALAYPSPLWSGDVVAAASGRFPAQRVSLPDGWTQIAAEVNDANEEGKVLVLPLTDFYQVPTTWGYYGSDLVPRWMIERPTIQPLAEGYFADRDSYRELVDIVEQALLRQDHQEAGRALQALGVEHVILRKDLDRDFPGRSFAPREQLASGVAGVPGAELVRATDVADLYAVRSPSGIVRSASEVLGAAAPELVTARAVADPVAVVVETTGAADAATVPPTETVREVELEQGDYAVTRTRASGSRLDLRLVREAPARVEVSEHHRVHLDDAPVTASEPAVVPAPPSPEWAVSSGTQVTLAEVDRATVFARSGTTIATHDLTGGVASIGPFSPVADCSGRAPLSLADAGISVRALNPPPGVATGLTAQRNSACVTASAALTAGSIHRVRFEYRTLSGKRPRSCLYQRGPEACVALPALETSAEWRSYDQTFAVADGTTGLDLFLYADGGGVDAPLTDVEFRNVSLRTIAPFATWTVPGAGEAVTVTVEAGRHRLGVAGDERELLGPFLASPPCRGAAPSEGAAGAGQVAGVLRLRAGAQADCVSAALDETDNGEPVRVRFEYRTISGRAARFCLYSSRAGRCESPEQLPSSTEWRTYDEVTDFRASPGRLRLFLYADVEQGATTVTEFRRASVTTARPFTAAIARTPTSAAPRPARGTWTAGGAYDVDVPAAATERIVVLHESFSRHWRLQGASGARHFMVDGYANAWRLPAGAATEVRLTYGPNRLRPILFLVLAATAAVASLKRRRPRPATAGSGSVPPESTTAS